MRKYKFIALNEFICEECYNKMVSRGWETDDFEIVEVIEAFECNRCFEIISRQD